MRNTAFVIPSYNPGDRLLKVVSELLLELERSATKAQIVVVDDGSTDGSIESLPEGAVVLLRHPENRGKGAALKTAFAWAQECGVTHLVTLDADGQHPVNEAVRLFHYEAEDESLVLAVRDMKGAGAPRANQFSNRFSNQVLSLFGGRRLLDTQCGLRRYPVKTSLALLSPANGYAFESDMVLRAARRRVPIVHVPTAVIYPEESERLSYFDSVKDPTRIVFQVVTTALSVPARPLSSKDLAAKGS